MSQDSNFLKNTVDLLESDPEIKSYIYQQILDFNPFVTPEMRDKVVGKGSFSSILSLTRGGDGILRGVRDIKVERCSHNCTGR